MSAFRKPPAIEPLSDISWQRIENRVFDTLDSETALGLHQPMIPAPTRSLRLAVALSAAVAAAAAVIVFFAVRSDDRTATVSEVSRIVTEDSASHLTVDDSALHIAPQSALIVQRDIAGGVFVVLERGSARFAVAPRGQRPPFVVQAGNARIEVVGTKFAVTRTGDSVRVTVEEGRVRITAGGDVTVIGAKETWPAIAATADRDPGDETANAANAASRTASKRRDESTRATRRAARRASQSETSPEAQSETEPEAPASPAKRFATAARLERSDPGAAIAIYRELTKLGGRWGANSLFAWASLEHYRGKKTTARRLFQRYLKRYPNGLNAADARRMLQHSGN